MSNEPVQHPSPTEPDYRLDREFSKLLARRSDVDLTVAALEIARDAYPGLDFDETLRWVQRRAESLREHIAALIHERDAMAALAHELGKRQGLCGSDAAYDYADSSYLHRVIATGVGIPISLSLIYMAVAERIGLSLGGVSAPQHFLTRCDTPEGPLFLDAYTPGRILDEDECVAWLARISGLDADQVRPSLETAGPRMILVRVLNNLKVVYAKRSEWGPAWHVQHRLAALDPGSYAERRDLGILSLHAGRTARAIDLLEGCLRGCPDDERNVLREHLQLAHKQLAHWN